MLILYFILAFFSSVIGSVPLGPVNLCVVSTTVKKSFNKGMEFALAAAIVDVAFILLALYSGKLIERFLIQYDWIQLVLFVVFVLLGVVLFFLKGTPELKDSETRQIPEFVKGLIISAMNPPVMLYWVFAVAIIVRKLNFDLSGMQLMVFLAGVFFTKLFVLFMYARLANNLRPRLGESNALINRILGVVLILIGCIQAIKYFFVT